jgi:hypothetical protein
MSEFILALLLVNGALAAWSPLNRKTWSYQGSGLEDAGEENGFVCAWMGNVPAHTSMHAGADPESVLGFAVTGDHVSPTGTLSRSGLITNVLSRTHLVVSSQVVWTVHTCHREPVHVHHEL